MDGPDRSVQAGDQQPLIGRAKSQANHKRTRTLCYVGLFVCCLEKLVSGSVFAFSVYANDLKSTFNYTQTEVETIISSSNFGQGFAVFPGLFVDRFGPRLSCAVGIVVTVTPLILLWSSTFWVSFYRNKYLLVALYYAITGMGSMFCYIASQNTSLTNFKSAWRGRIIGFQDSLYGGSLMIFSQLYYNVFQTNSPNTGSTMFSGFSGFMFLLAVSFAVVDVLCLLFSKFFYDGDYDQYLANEARPRSSIYGSSTNTDELQDVNGVDSNDVEIENKVPEHVPFLKIITKYQYNIYLWTFVLVGSVAAVTLNNLTVAAKALGYSDHNNLVLSVDAVTSFLCSLTTGILADLFGQHRVMCQLIATLIGCIATVVYSWTCQYFSGFLIASMLVVIPSAMMWTVVPAELSDRFGIVDLGRNFGFIRAVQTLFIFVFQYIFGYLYEQNITKEGSIDCYGVDCVRTGYIFLFGVNFAAFFAFAGVGYRAIRRRTH